MTCAQIEAEIEFLDKLIDALWDELDEGFLELEDGQNQIHEAYEKIIEWENFLSQHC